MDLTEKRLSGELKYSGVIVTVTLDEAQLCDGRIAKREVVHHPGGVSVLPVDENGDCYMVRQFRYPVGHTVLEIPAGKLEAGEEHMSCAVRELSEETGFRADEFVDLGCFYTSPGYSDELLHVYLARGLHAGKSHPDEGEFLNVEKIPLSTLVEMAMSGQIIDAKTVIAILKANQYLGEK
ncbi:MAG: NUDIX hydrolase [Oscillospiraceae bacterium]|nr:NUDIX hydrolase [Oscillospiraceae bacterium]